MLSIVVGLEDERSQSFHPFDLTHANLPSADERNLKVPGLLPISAAMLMGSVCPSYVFDVMLQHGVMKW